MDHLVRREIVSFSRENGGLGLLQGNLEKKMDVLPFYGRGCGNFLCKEDSLSLLS